MLISRRNALKGLGAATIAAGATSLAAPALSQGLTKVTFTTSWIPEGPNLFAYVARDKGFWKNHGLDVSVARGSGSGAAAQAVSAGTFDFGMAATPTVIIQAAKKLPITCIGQINYDALMGVGVLAGSPIRTPKDLEGKKLGASVSSGEYPFMPLYAEKAGFGRADCPQTDRFFDNMVSFPFQQWMSEEQFELMASLVRTSLERMRAPHY